MDIIWIVIGAIVYSFIGFIITSAMDAWDDDSGILIIFFWPIMLLSLILVGIFFLAVYIGTNIRKVFKPKPNPCDGCDNSWMTKGLSCDHCYHQSNYYKASDEEIKNFYKIIYEEKEKDNERDG